MLRVALTVAFLVVPLLEVFVIVSVGQVIGGWQTVGLLFAMSILGTYVVRREGASAWRELQGALGSGRIPGRELADAALVLVGGTLLLTPGFLTDVVGLFLLLPFTRPLARRLLIRVVARRVPVVGVVGLSGMGTRAPGRDDAGDRLGRPRRPGPAAPGGRVVEGEVVRDEGGPDQGPR
jgi:UPF0716 protein FxsA